MRAVGLGISRSEGEGYSVDGPRYVNEWARGPYDDIWDSSGRRAVRMY